MLLPVVPSGTGGWVIISPTGEILTVIGCGWEHCIIRYNVTRARIGRGQDSHKRRDLDLVRRLPSSSYGSFALCCLHRRPGAETGRGSACMETQQQAMRRPTLQPTRSVPLAWSQVAQRLALFSLSASWYPHVDRSRYDITMTKHCAANQGRYFCHEYGGGANTMVRNLTVISSK